MSYTTLHVVNIGVATFLFLPGLKLDEKSIENGFEGSLGCLFWGGCHHPKSSRLLFLMAFELLAETTWRPILGHIIWPSFFGLRYKCDLSVSL